MTHMPVAALTAAAWSLIVVSTPTFAQEAAGLARCSYRNLSAGIVAIHTGYKA